MSGRKIMILGLAQPSRDWVREQPDDVEIWGLNETHYVTERLTRLFQLHVRDWREQERKDENDGVLPEWFDHNCFGRNKRHVEWLREAVIPIYTQKKWRDIPMSTVYPFKEVRETVGVLKRDQPSRKDLYATNTMAYMLALAITEHKRGETVEEIRMAGVEVMSGRERWFERESVTFYCGMAMGLGIKVLRSPYGEGLLDGHHYAIEPYPEVPALIKEQDKVIAAEHAHEYLRQMYVALMDKHPELLEEAVTPVVVN